MEYLIVFLFQFLFQLTRIKSNKFIYKNNIIMVTFYSTLIQILWLVSSYYGIIGILKQDYLLSVLYVLGGSIGAFIGMLEKRK